MVACCVAFARPFQNGPGYERPSLLLSVWCVRTDGCRWAWPHTTRDKPTKTAMPSKLRTTRLFHQDVIIRPTDQVADHCIQLVEH